MAKSVAEVLKLREQVDMIDLRFTDLFGQWHHFSTPARELNEDMFEEGLGFDGSSIRGFQTINESDMILIPDPASALIDPVMETPTLVLICEIYDPITRQPYTKDARYVAKKAEEYLKSTGIADVAYFGPEAEFFLFDNVTYGGSANEQYYSVDSGEAWWNSGMELETNMGGQIPPKRGYFPTPPADTFQEVRTQMVKTLEEAGVFAEVHHHEVGVAQNEIDIRFDTLGATADRLMIYKYIIKNVARQYGLSATFMPKPLFEDNGSGMHCHQSLWKGDTNTFYDENGYVQLSDTARYYIGGLIKHAPAVLAFAAPSTNSYRRLVPGYEAPVKLAYSQRNRSACVRIPMYSKSPKAKRVEFRPPDPTCNPYLAFSAMLMAGLDGIQNQIDPGEPFDKDLYDLPPEEAAQIQSTPGSLAEALDELEADMDFLLQGDVFTPDLLEAYIAYKREHEVEALNLRPHPHEFALYYDI